MQPSDLTQRKREIRRHLRALRRDLDPRAAEEASLAIADQLCALPIWRDAVHVALYLDTDGELPTASLNQRARSEGKCVYLPAVVGDEMEFRPWKSGDSLVPNRYGIDEPASEAVLPEQLELMLVPVVGWASDGTRLGMGGGFYDRFLARAETAKLFRLGLALEIQRDETLRSLRQHWDQQLHGVVTEKGYYDCSR